MNEDRQKDQIKQNEDRQKKNKKNMLHLYIYSAVKKSLYDFHMHVFQKAFFSLRFATWPFYLIAISQKSQGLIIYKLFSLRDKQQHSMYL